MTSTEIQLIKTSWRTLRGLEPHFIGDLFYSKLFIESPRLRALFPADFCAQAIKLVDMLNLIVAHVDNLEALTNEIKESAKRHVKYGVKPAHYEKVGVALLWTLKQAFSSDWCPDLAEAWANCYNTLASKMINAAEKDEQGFC